MASRKYSKSHPGQSTQIISPPLRANFLALDDKIMGANAQAQVTPNMTVIVTSFDYLGADGLTWRSYAGGTSPAFAAPTVNPKIGVLTVNDAGSLAWTYGAEAAVPLKPNLPAGTLPICFVHGRVGMTTITDDDVGSNGFILAQASALRTTAAGGAVSVVTQGQCRLGLSGATLQLLPYNGSLLTINSANTAIPDAGVTLGTGGLAASTTYYIYAYLAGAVLTLEASATAPVTQAGTGLRIKGGPDASRTLVGLARTTAATAWADTAGMRYVLSYFNRLPKFSATNFTVDRTFTNTAGALEVHAEIRNHFIAWADDTITASYSGAWNNTATTVNAAYLALDGVYAPPWALHALTASQLAVLTLVTAYTALTEGSPHYVTMTAYVSAGTGSFQAAGRLNVMLNG